MNIKLSVCVTSYNRARGLSRTLESLSAQTRLPDELIVSDDCSIDDISQVVLRWKDRFPLLRYNRNLCNLNMPGNLNAAVGMAQGEYIANLHDADEFEPSLLEDWEKALDDHPTAGFVFCGVAGGSPETKYNDGITLQSDGIIVHNVAPITAGREFYEKYFLHRLSSIVWGTVMARRSAYNKLLPFDPAFSFISDVDMWMRMCLHFDVAYIRKPLIILDGDHSPAKWGCSGIFNWSALDLSREMQEVNIKRFYKDQPELLRCEIGRHRRLVQWVYLKRIFGRVKNRDWHGVKEGLGLCRNFGWPLRLGRILSHG